MKARVCAVCAKEFVAKTTGVVCSPDCRLIRVNDKRRAREERPSTRPQCADCDQRIDERGAKGRCRRCYLKYRRENASSYPCSVDGCGKTVMARKLCSKHYQRWVDTGDVGNDGPRSCGGCGIDFHPRRSYQIWCSSKCGARESARKRLKVKNVAPLERTCWWCGETFRNPDSRRRKSCSDVCARNLASLRDLSSKYGITKDQYRSLYREQGGKCAICRHPERSTRNTLLAVDHDHVSGHVKGLLCSHCNRAIGLLGDDPQIIKRAAEYVIRTRQMRLIL